jgi:hypothetical protein
VSLGPRGRFCALYTLRAKENRDANTLISGKEGGRTEAAHAHSHVSVPGLHMHELPHLVERKGPGTGGVPRPHKHVDAVPGTYPFFPEDFRLRERSLQSGTHIHLRQSGAAGRYSR